MSRFQFIVLLGAVLAMLALAGWYLIEAAS